jgi:hypothetical protein
MWQGLDRLGAAGCGKEMQGMAGHGPARRGRNMVRRGMVRSGKDWLGEALQGKVRFSGPISEWRPIMSQKADVSIKGISPLLMHKYPLIPIVALEKKPPADQAELAAYRDPQGKLYIPGTNIQRALVQGATFSKGKGRASLQKEVCACVLISPEYCVLPQQSYEVDSRPIVVPATKGRVLRHRPRLDEWDVSFSVEWDEVLITEAQVRKIMDDTGSRVGLLDFRPEKKGSFGRFMVTKWDAS